MARFADYEPGHRSGAPPKDLLIRDAVAADVPALAEIRATRGDATAEQARPGLERLLARAARGEALVLVAETSGAVAAFGMRRAVRPSPRRPPPLRARGVWHPDASFTGGAGILFVTA